MAAIERWSNTIDLYDEVTAALFSILIFVILFSKSFLAADTLSSGLHWSAFSDSHFFLNNYS